MWQALVAIWSPHFYYDVVLMAQTCADCEETDEQIKTIISQNEWGELLKVIDVKQEIARKIAGPSQIFRISQCYLFSSIGHNSAGPDAMSFRETNG